MANKSTFRFARIAAAAALLCALTPGAHAQDAVVTVTGQGIARTGVAGFGDTPLARSPLQAAVIGTQQLGDAGITSIGGLTRLDASLGDAYNADGYWSIISARGFTLDNRYNYRRDGLPINAETAIALENKERIEVLKGTSGIQAGTSAPGGLVDLVVKRPTGSVHEATLQFRQPGSAFAAVDLGDRFGSEGRFGLRLNAAYEKLDPMQRHTQGERSLLALAGDWQIAPATLLQAEMETSHQSQPSVAAFSMTGDVVPAARDIDPRLNLNNQPWRQPVVMDGTTASLKLQQRLSADWRVTVHAMQQRLKSDDREAFPYGVYDPVTYDCNPCDRFGADGSFTYWQFASDNERRTTRNLSLAFSGAASSLGIEHQIETGVLLTRYRARFQDEVYDIAGTGNIDGTRVTPPSPGGIDANTNRDERSTELFVRDAMRLNERAQVWAGLRHSRLDRAAVRTSVDEDGSVRATDYRRNSNLPWLALAYRLTPRTMLYGSWGKGLETDVTPNRALYANPGESLLMESRQFEFGVKHGNERVEAALTVFDIERGQTADIGACDGTAGSCARRLDGTERHRGVEAQGTLQLARWSLQASAMSLSARRHGSVSSEVNGQRPVNVPVNTLRLGAEYHVVAIDGLALQANLMAESDRVVLPDDSGKRIPGWTRLDLGARWKQSWQQTTLLWRVGIDNAIDRRAWKESPYQFDHVYLYPLAPRTLRASVQASY